MAVIDRNSKTPIYKQIYEDINQRITDGEYALGSMLPSENRLCSMYGVERATVRKALAMMVEDGKIAKVQGLGSSVIDPAEKTVPDIKKNLVFLLSRGYDNRDRINEPFNAKLMDAFDRECSGRGYSLLYKPFSSDDSVDLIIESSNPAGVFYTNSLPTDMYRQFLKRGVPVVLVNISHPMYPSVCLDNRGGAKMVMEYLLDLGHRRIAFISGGRAGQIHTGRLYGYKDGLEQSGIPFDGEMVYSGDWSIESGRQAMKRFMEQAKLPTAIFAANDSMALGAMLEAMSSGIAIPDDLSIVGFDNIDQAEQFNPALTTVGIDYSTMSRAACMLMLDMINHDNSELDINIYVPLRLVERESARRL